MRGSKAAPTMACLALREWPPMMIRAGSMKSRLVNQSTARLALQPRRRNALQSHGPNSPANASESSGRPYSGQPAR